MIEWWQTLLISWGASFSVGALAVVIYLLTAKDNRAAEEQRAKGRLEEGQRDTIRQIRRERVEPILEFLKLAKHYFAQSRVEVVVGQMYDNSAIKESMTLRELRERIKAISPEGYPGERDDLALYRALVFALAAASTEEMQSKLLDVHEAITEGKPPKIKSTDTITAVEDFIEQYVAGIEPAETPAEAKEQSVPGSGL